MALSRKSNHHRGTDSFHCHTETIGVTKQTLSEHTYRHTVNPMDQKPRSFAKRIIARHQAEIEYQRKRNICSECGGKALYYIAGKQWCKGHVAIGVAAHKKKWDLYT